MKQYKNKKQDNRNIQVDTWSYNDQNFKRERWEGRIKPHMVDPQREKSINYPDVEANNRRAPDVVKNNECSLTYINKR